MNFKSWLSLKEQGATLSSGITGGPGDIANYTRPIGLVRKDMYATIPRRRRRRSARRRHIE